MSRAQFCPLLLSIGFLLAGCASYSGIHGEAHALAPQSLAFDQNPGGGDWPRSRCPVDVGGAPVRPSPSETVVNRYPCACSCGMSTLRA